MALSDITTGTRFSLIKDFNGNGVFEGDDFLRSQDVSAKSSGSIDQPIEAGTYFVKVQPRYSSSNTNYKLRIAI